VRVIEIDRLGAQGDGVARLDDDSVYVPFGAPGDKVDYDPRTKKAPALRQAGPERVAPPCPHHGNINKIGCGGCRLQHVGLDFYKDWKRDKVLRALARSGIDATLIEPLITSPPSSRRRAALGAEGRNGKTALGFAARGTHRIIDLQVCLILKPELTALFEPLRALTLLRDRERADYHLTAAASGVQFLLERKRAPDLGEREGLAAFAEAHDLAGISWRSGPRQEAEPIAQRRPLLMDFGGVRVPIAPGAFLQATADGEAAMVRIVKDSLPAACRTLDLFAGSGTFTFPAAAHGPVHAVESNPAAIQSIKAVRHANVSATQRDLFREPLKGKELAGYDAALFDPPYAGAKAQAAALAQSDIPLVIGMSCNPVSFAEDAATLLAGGYTCRRIVPVDQFLWSAEVEVVGVFRR
jgi:23S rRNA (uracil1939-C5)-methyltransferase